MANFLSQTACELYFMNKQRNHLYSHTFREKNKFDFANYVRQYCDSPFCLVNISPVLADHRSCLVYTDT